MCFFVSIRGMLPRRRRLLAFLLAAVATSVGCGSEEGAGDSGHGTPEAVVELLTLETEVLRNVVDIPGQLDAELTVQIRPEIEGILESIRFAEGDVVSKGAVLFQLRDVQEHAQLNEAEAELALAQATHRRTEMLAGRGVSSKAQLERTGAELRVAEARVESAKVGLERTLVRAPFDGVVGALLVAPGHRVRENTTLVRIDAVERLQLRFHLPERAVGLVKPGIPVRIKVAAHPDRRFDGEVYFVSPTLDPAGRRILIKAWVPNPDGMLRPGMFAEIEAEVARSDDALLVPESALVYDLDGTYVWLIDGESRARRTKVELGLRHQGRVEVAEGLAAGDLIVAAGIHKVRGGGLVRAAETDAPVSAAEAKRKPPERSGES
jgi:membrane fusion protein (multidrug efflux system)